MSNKKYLLHSIVIIMVAVLLVSCGTTGSAKLQGEPWVNSNLYGNWPAEKPSQKDNLELSANYDMYMIAQQKGIQSDSSFDRSDEYMSDVIYKLITDPSYVSDELTLVRTYMDLITDIEKRNNEGYQPLVDYYDLVYVAENVKELSRVLQTGLLFGDFFAKFDVTNSATDYFRYGLVITPNILFMNSDFENEEEFQETCDLYGSYLLALGYKEEDLDRIMQNIVDFAITLMEAAEAEEATVVNMSLDQIYRLSKPLYDLIIGFGYYNPDATDICYTVYWPEVFEKLDELYIDDNLDIIKTFIGVAMAEYAMDYLAVGTDVTEEELMEAAYNYVNTALAGAIDQIYLEFVLPEGMREQVYELTLQYMDAMSRRIEGETWLSAETKQKALEKLENMVAIVVYPDQWLDFSYLQDQVEDHDTYLLDAALCRDDYYRYYRASFLGEPIERGNWVLQNMKSTEANAYYIPSENSINIYAGVLTEDLYYSDSLEGMLASLGCTIGHEITHGFDTNGSNFDAFGRESNWWTDADRQAFDDKAAKVADLLSTVTLLDGYKCNGSQVIDEFIADLGGLALSLDLAEEKADFDYVKFFDLSAKVYFQIYPSVEDLIDLYESDAHPADYIRVNLASQQFEEFYNAYGVKAGDGMYLAPNLRVSVW